MIKVGLTGGIGSGKSTVARIFITLGAPVFHADEESRALLKGTGVRDQIELLLGKEIHDGNGNINRSKVAAIVFANPEKLAALNAILHPLVREKFNAFCEQHKNSPYVIEEAAILFESGAYKNVNKIITVECGEGKRIQRVMERDKASENAVKLRVSRQMSDAERRERSDFVIINDESELVIPQVLDIHKLLVSSIE